VAAELRYGLAVVEDGVTALPEDPLLADAAKAFDEMRQWAWIVDSRWQLVFISEELRATFGYDPPLPTAFLGEAWLSALLSSPLGSNTVVQASEIAAGIGGLMLTDIGPVSMRAQLDPRLRDAVESQSPVDIETFSYTFTGAGVTGIQVTASSMTIRLRDVHGRLAGTAIVSKPAVGDRTLATLAMHSDPDHLARMQQVGRAARRPAAILFADLEGSSSLARRMPTASYFRLARRLVRAADHHVVAAGGLVGRHVGDGLAAFFLAETAGSESAAARACLDAARGFRRAVADIAHRSDLEAADVIVRMGLHWGATLYVGNITTEGRAEVTALGDEVNQAARIEASATGGRTLVAKDLVERLSPDDAAALGIDTAHLTFTTIGELATATAKAQRDAPTIAVCEI
jgi:class 3 adenylate cyclase